MDALSDNYVRYYKLQSGGRLNVFYGQDGQGIGDVLKGAIGKSLPYIFPMVKGTVNDFLDTTEKMIEEGKSGKEVFKTALKAGLKGGLAKAKDKFLGDIGMTDGEQSGSGRKRKRRSTKRKGAKRRKTTRVYKRPKSTKRKRKSTKRKRSRKLNFKTNF